VSALPDVTALGVGAVARLGLDPSLTVAEAVPEWKPSAVYEPRAGADQAAERRARFRTAVSALLGDAPA
ncbi:FGGY family carbohydrate kinase, partial [Streptomyces sp. NPDC054840]